MNSYGDYTIIEEAGSGGCGQVFLVKKKDSPEKIAYILKTIDEFMKDEDDIKTLRNEIDKLRKLNEDPKPFIPTLYAFDKFNFQNAESCDKNHEESKENKIQDEEDIENAQPYYVIDYYSRQILFYYIRYIHDLEEGFSEKHAKLIFKKIVEAIKYCHDKNICHLDIKPNNIMIDKDYNINILDFGYSAEIRDENKEVKRYGKGTKEYVCPEMLEGKEFTGAEADIFSLGVVLFNLVTAKKGFFTADKEDTFYREIVGDTSGTFEKYWNQLSEHINISNLSENFKKLYTKMVAYNPKDRPTIEEVLSSPWLEEINNLNDEERKNLEDEVKAELKQIYEERIKESTDPEVIKVDEIIPEGFSTNRSFDDKKQFFDNLNIK